MGVLALCLCIRAARRGQGEARMRTLLWVMGLVMVVASVSACRRPPRRRPPPPRAYGPPVVVAEEQAPEQPVTVDETVASERIETSSGTDDLELEADEEPPPAKVEAEPAPRAGHVWVRGHWVRRGGQWVWAPGVWHARPRHRANATWAGGRWVKRGRRWAWVGGRWR